MTIITKQGHFIMLLVMAMLLTACNAGTVNFYQLNVSDLEDKKVDLADYKGKPVLLNFWATWCPPCRKEKPKLNKAQKILKKDGITVICISEEPLEDIINFKNKYHYDLTYLRSNTNIKLLGVFEIPQTYLINEQGEVVYAHQGYNDWDSPIVIDSLRAALQ